MYDKSHPYHCITGVIRKTVLLKIYLWHYAVNKINIDELI